jgi:hypothetical protein
MEHIGDNNFVLAPTVGGTIVSLDGHNHNHDLLTSLDADDHIDHTGVTLTAGIGLIGGGTIAANRTFDLDVNGLTADGTPDTAADYVSSYDASAGTHKKVLLDNLGIGGGGATYTEYFTQISDPASLDTWTTKTLSVAANSVAVVLARNSSSGITKNLGVREVGSSIARFTKVDLGYSICFNVQVNASSQIQIYREHGSIDFWLIGELS